MFLPKETHIRLKLVLCLLYTWLPFKVKFKARISYNLKRNAAVSVPEFARGVDSCYLLNSLKCFLLSFK